MNVAKSFVEYMESLGMGTFSTDIFVGGIPQDAPDNSWWVISSGGSPIRKNHTGERIKDYILDVFYRNTNAEDVYESIQEFEEEINSKGCVQLSGYDTVEMEASILSTDRDIDNEDRVLSLLQVRISIYQNYRLIFHTKSANFLYAN